MSADKTRVEFNAPIIEEIGPPRAPGRPTALPYNQIQNLAKALRELGWDNRAVVVKRVIFPNVGTLNTYEMSRPINWGVVIDLRTTAIAITGQPFLPIKVQWMKDGSISEHWPEELALIHKAVSQWEVEILVKKEQAVVQHG